MNYDFSDGVLEEAFDVVEGYVSSPIKEDEFTAKMMQNKYDNYTRRHWLSILDRAERDGKLESRSALCESGKTARAFRVVEGEEFNGERK